MEVPVHDGDPQGVRSGQRPHPPAPSQVPLKAHVRGDSCRQTPGRRGGVPAGRGEHNPSRPGNWQDSHPLSQRLLQHSPSKQDPLRQSSGSVHFVPGTPVSTTPASSTSLSFVGASITTATAASGGGGGGPVGVWGTVHEAPMASARAVKASRRGDPRIMVAIKTTVVALQSALCFLARKFARLHTIKWPDLDSKARPGVKAGRARLGSTL